MPERAPIVIRDVAVPKGGQSSETYLLELLIGDAGDTASWVLRVEPRDHQVYEDPSVERQFRMAETISAHSALPVPRPIRFEVDEAWIGAPFFVMERAAGETPPDAYHSEGVLFAASPAERERLWYDSVGLLARLNALDPALFGFLAYPPAADHDGLTQELARWDSYRGWAHVPADPVLTRARRWLDDHRPAAATHGVAWGDARLGNILMDGGRCVGMLDWETASLGGAETDLGWWIFYDRLITEAAGVPRLEGIGDGPATIAAWESAAGRKAQAMDWHIVFAGYRFAMIVERASALARGEGKTVAQGQGGTNAATRLLETLIR
ncbi:MAG: phosphotransferase family protein [Sphingomonadaceae bacterium]|nr:phosphotransferase family protein [Sphingomonadaceae bacterium]